LDAHATEERAKERHVLGEGYPHVYGTRVHLAEKGEYIFLKKPHLWGRYRLVLEKVEGKKVKDPSEGSKE
jgi:hypothetical protein